MRPPASANICENSYCAAFIAAFAACPCGVDAAAFLARPVALLALGFIALPAVQQESFFVEEQAASEATAMMAIKCLSIELTC